MKSSKSDVNASDDSETAVNRNSDTTEERFKDCPCTSFDLQLLDRQFASFFARMNQKFQSGVSLFQVVW